MTDRQIKIRNLLRREGPKCPGQLSLGVHLKTADVQEGLDGLLEEGLVKVTRIIKIRGREEERKVYDFK